MRLLPLLLLALTAVARAAEYAPTDAYERRTVEGWDVRVSRELTAKEPELAGRVMDLMRVKLSDVNRALPAAAIDRLRPKVPVWVELDDKRFPGMCYHPAVEWLRANGFNPDKAGGVEVGNARNFIGWSRDQPAMVLHELAHAYHHQVLGFDDPDVRGAYEAAKAAGLYDHVLRGDGHRERAYAMQDDQEYFAECSEAYFATNDFYPFVRAELKEHDPRMYGVLRKAWVEEKRAGKPTTRRAGE